jgi:ERCC4-type nuclease
MMLIIDKSEQASNPKVVEQLQKNFSQTIIANLPHHNYGGTNITSGDINIPLDDGSLLAIERKTPEDFLGSIKDRHIFNQVEVMAANAKYSAIVVTGKFFYGKDDIVYIEKGDKKAQTNWTGNSVRAVIYAIQFSGCPVIFCPASEYSNTIAAIYNLVNQSDRHQGVVKNRVITFPPVDARVENLAQLPGISLTLAERLLQKAGEFDDNKDEEGYGTIPGALQYLTIMMAIDKASRPAGFGQAKVFSLRKFFQLNEDEYIGKIREIEYKKKPAVEINGSIYVKAKEL